MNSFKRGMTLLEVMVALIVMGISSYAAYELWTGAEKSSARTTQLGEMGDFIDQANQVAAKVLTDIGPESNRGICRLIRLNQADAALHVIGSGVVPMNLVLFRPTPQGSTSTFVNRDLLNPYDTDATNGPAYDDWNKVFGDGRWIPDPNCNDAISPELSGAGRFQRCYKPDPTKWPQVASAEVLQDRNPRIIVNLSAIEFKSSGGSLNKLSVVPYPASSAAWTNLNAIEHAMLVTVKATWKSVQREESQTVFSVVWPGEYTCLGGFKAKNNVTAKNNAASLYASNYSQYELQMDWWREHSKDTITQLNAAPGFTTTKLFSSSYTKVFFNVSGVGSGSLDTANTSYILLYSSTFPDSDMSVSWYKTIATQAEKQTLQNENRAVTTETALFATGCQERQFRCKRKTTVPRLWSPRMDITTYLDYKRNVGVSSRPVLSFQRGSVNPSSTLAITTYLTDPPPAAAAALPSGPHVKFIHQNYNPSINSGNISLTKGTGEFLMSLDNLDQAQACPTMCSASNENNSGWYPSIQFPGVKGKDTFVDDNPVACLCCTMKQCYAYGNKMASCSFQPVEALDASLPECEADDSTKINSYGAVATAFEAASAGSLVDDICIAAKVVNGALVYETRACDTNLGSLCYSVGRYFVAKNTANTAIATSAFDGANDVCFNIGFNNVRAASSGANVSGGLVELLTAQGTIATAQLPPVANNLYSYVDGGLQGHFLAPQTDTLEAQVLAAINKQTAPANAASYWVAWKGKDNTLVAPAPKVAPLNTASANIYTSYYDDNVSVPKLRYVKDGIHGFTTSPASSATAAILIHSRRYKGVISALPTQTRALKVLCWDPAAAAPGFVLSAASTSNQAGDATHLSAAEICWNENKFFIAPTKTLEWIDAMLMLAPNHAMLPWPQPKNASGAEIALNDEVTAGSNNYLPAAWVGMSSNGTNFEQFYRFKFKTAFITGTDEKKDQTAYYLITGKLPTTLSTNLSNGDLLCRNNTTGAFTIEMAVATCPAGTTNKTILDPIEWKNQSLTSLKAKLALIKSTYSSVSLSSMSGDAKLNVETAIVTTPP